MTPCTLSHYATGQDYFFFGAEFRSLRFTRTRTTFCIIVIERPRHGRVIVNTLSPCSEMMQLIGWVLARKGRILKHNLYGIEIEVPKLLCCKDYRLQFGGATYAPHMRVERTRRRFLSYSSACTCRLSMRGRSR